MSRKIKKLRDKNSDQQNQEKEIDYLHRQYPCQSREFVTKAFQEGRPNGRKTIKILNSAASTTNSFLNSPKFNHLN